jgi:hypothetical protein
VDEFNGTLVKLESQQLLAQEMVGMLNNLDRNPDSAGRLPLTIPRQEEINECTPSGSRWWPSATPC